jgi:hypothetical protein
MVGFVRTAPPMEVLAPASDRAGNLYILGGTRARPDTAVFIVRAGGGVTSGCRLSKGDAVGPLGWVGFSQDRQWYWSGGALVAVTAAGDCRTVLDRDPTTGSDLFFKAVVPRVFDRPSRTSLVALVQAPTDPRPTTVLVDLDARIYTLPRAFEPPGATNVVVLGVGASSSRREGFVALRFDEGKDVRVEARFVDEDGALEARVALPLPADLPAYGLRGFLHANEQGLVAGLLPDKRLLMFDRTSARVAAVAGMEPVGVHEWEGSLYVVGTANGGPAIAPILDDGSVDGVRPWESSALLLRGLSRPLDVSDDRAPPRRGARFDLPRAADGPFPLVTEHGSTRLARGTTALLVAGPTVGEGLSAFTLLAVAPVGVSYP